MSYIIHIEWATSKRGLYAFRTDPCLGTKQVEGLDEVIAEEVPMHFAVDEYDNDPWESFDHWGKAGRTTYHDITVFNKEAVAAFKAAVQEAVGPAIWDELYSFEVTAEGEPDEDDEDEELETD